MSDVVAFSARQRLAAEVNFVINAGIAVTALVYVLATQPLDDWRAMGLVVSLVLSVALQVLAVVLVGRDRWRVPGLHLALSAQVLAIFCAVVVSGGPPLAAPNSLFVLCPATAWMVLGARGGITWFCVVMVVELVALALNLWPGFYVNLRQPEDLAMDHVLVWTYCVLAVTGLAWGLGSLQPESDGRE